MPLKKNLKQDSKNEISTVFKALGDSIRVEIALMLLGGPQCVCVIKDCLEMADSRLSYHLNIMKRAGLIEGKRSGSWIHYSLTREGMMWARTIEEFRKDLPR